MKYSVAELRELILGLTQDITFEWNGKHGLIEPFSINKFILCFGEDDAGTEFHDVDEMLKSPYIDGKSLESLCGKVMFI